MPGLKYRLSASFTRLFLYSDFPLGRGWGSRAISEGRLSVHFVELTEMPVNTGRNGVSELFGGRSVAVGCRVLTKTQRVVVKTQEKWCLAYFSYDSYHSIARLSG